MQLTRLLWPIVQRTRFFDEQVLSAIGAGVKQVVICGAGYDDRALRFRTSGVRFFEIDHPVTQADKAQRLRMMGADMKGLTLIPADFRADNIAAKLDDAGHKARCPTLFLCEGVLVYLDQQVNHRLLVELRSRAAPDSVLAASLAIHRDGVDSNAVAAAINGRRRSGQSEPWMTILSADSYCELFKQAGWKIDTNFASTKRDSHEIHGRMTLITAKPI
jgi:methyltransferase (TIGR00027 family)